MAAAERLRKEGIAVRCVSMPSRDLFDALPEADRDAVFPPSIRAPLAVGAGSTLGWHRYVGAVGDVIGVDRFGASAPGGVVMRKYGFSIDNVCPRAKALLDQRRAWPTTIILTGVLPHEGMLPGHWLSFGLLFQFFG